jgi:hypothetical protein
MMSRHRRLLAALADDGRLEIERARLVALVVRLLELPPPPDHVRQFPHFVQLQVALAEAAAAGDGEAIEERFLELYCHLHMHEAPYTAEERRVVDATGGYWCHAGGLSPVLKAGQWIRPDTVSADYGAGNGLQALLLQLLYPHRCSVQIEISGRMATIGQGLQAWLGIDEDRVSWHVSDVREVPARGFDFIYLYRPVRPEGAGLDFYRGFAADLAAAEHEVVIFSIADCLGSFLPERFVRFYHDGHLACYRG